MGYIAQTFSLNFVCSSVAVKPRNMFGLSVK